MAIDGRDRRIRGVASDAYITSVERFAEARGQARIVLSLLSEVCGTLPEGYEDRVRQLPSPALDGLPKALLRFRSLADLQSWLRQYEDDQLPEPGQ